MKKKNERADTVFVLFLNLIYVKNQEIIVIWVVFSIGKYRELSAHTLDDLMVKIQQDIKEDIESTKMATGINACPAYSPLVLCNI